MVDGIEGIGGYGGGHSGGGRGAPSPHVPARRSAPPSAAPFQEPAAFAPIADLLDDVARLTVAGDPAVSGAEADDVAAQMLGEAERTLGMQARLDAACVRALLEPIGPAR